jgi:hypothetical protein
MAIADATQYEVRKCQSGILLYVSTSATAFADCKTQATVLAAEYPAEQLCVIPQGYPVLSNRPLLPFPYPTAGQPVLVQES